MSTSIVSCHIARFLHLLPAEYLPLSYMIQIALNLELLGTFYPGVFSNQLSHMLFVFVWLFSFAWSEFQFKKILYELF